MNNKLVITLIAVAGCGDNNQQQSITWGEAVQEIAISVCDRLTDCGYHSNAFEIGKCKVDVYQWLCEFDHNCDVSIDGESIGELDICLAAIDEFSCSNIGFGYLPEECAEIYGYQPDPIVVPTNGGGGNGRGSRGRGNGDEQ